jgi:hypothetical protein
MLTRETHTNSLKGPSEIISISSYLTDQRRVKRRYSDIKKQIQSYSKRCERRTEILSRSMKNNNLTLSCGLKYHVPLLLNKRIPKLARQDLSCCNEV